MLLCAAIRPWRQLPVWGAMLLVSAALTMTVSATSVAIGQSAPLILLGYAPTNGAAEMTGLRHLVYAVGLGDQSQLIYVLVGCALACALGAVMNSRAVQDVARVRSIMFVGLLTLTIGRCIPMMAYLSYQLRSRRWHCPAPKPSWRRFCFWRHGAATIWRRSPASSCPTAITLQGAPSNPSLSARP